MPSQNACAFCGQPIDSDPWRASYTEGVIGWSSHASDDRHDFCFHADCYQHGKEALLDRLRQYQLGIQLRGLKVGSAWINWDSRDYPRTISAADLGPVSLIPPGSLKPGLWDAFTSNSALVTSAGVILLFLLIELLQWLWHRLH